MKTTIKGSKRCYTDCRVGGLEEVEVEVEGVYYCSDTSRSAVVPSYSSDREGFQCCFADQQQPPRWGTTEP